MADSLDSLLPLQYYNHEFTLVSTHIDGTTERVLANHRRDTGTSPFILLCFHVMKTTYYCKKFQGNKAALDCEKQITKEFTLRRTAEHFKDLDSTKEVLRKFAIGRRKLEFMFDPWMENYPQIAEAIVSAIPSRFSSRLVMLEIETHINVGEYMVYKMDQDPLLLMFAETEKYEKKNDDDDTKEEEEEQCVICWQVLKSGEQIMRLPCKHSCFHDCCLRVWLERSDTCPMCRYEKTPPGIRSDFVYPS